MVTFNERDDIRERYGKPQRPSINYTRGDDVRDLMKSPAGKNYGNMMDLQNQAIRQGGFDKGDSRIAELKKARRQYNRKDKYNIANLMGYSPQEANEMYRTNSGVLREYARPTYKTMYPISDMAHEVTGSGGLTGMLLNKAFGKGSKAGKNFLEDLRQMGADIFGGVGIGGAVPRKEATEEVLQNYADKTFKPNMYDVAGPWFGTAPIEDVEISDLEGEVPDVFTPEELTREEKIQGLKDEIQEQIDNFENPFPLLPTQKDTDDMVFADVPEKYEDYIERGLQEPLPFDEGREDYIRRQNEYVSPVSAPLGIPDPQGDFDKFQEYPYPEIGIEFGGEPIPPIIPFDDAGRETGIASMYGQGPMWGETDRRYEKEYRSHIERTGDRMTYGEFERAWERMHALPRGLHFQEPRSGLR